MGGGELTLSLFSPSLLPLPSPRDQSNGRNLNKRKFVPFSSIPSLGITEIVAHCLDFGKRYAYEGSSCHAPGKHGW